MRHVLHTTAEPPASGPDVHLYVEVVLDLTAPYADSAARLISEVIRSEAGRCDLTLFACSGRTAEARPEEIDPQQALAVAGRFLNEPPAYHRVYLIDGQDARRLWVSDQQPLVLMLAHVLRCRVTRAHATACREGEQASVTVLDPPELSTGSVGYRRICAEAALLTAAIKRALYRRLTQPAPVRARHGDGEDDATEAAAQLAEWLAQRLDTQGRVEAAQQGRRLEAELTERLRGVLARLTPRGEASWAGLGQRIRSFCQSLEKRLVERFPALQRTDREVEQLTAQYEVQKLHYERQLREFKRQQQQAKEATQSGVKRVGAQPYGRRWRIAGVILLVFSICLVVLWPTSAALLWHCPAWLRWLGTLAITTALATGLQLVAPGKRQLVVQPRYPHVYAYLLAPARGARVAAAVLGLLGSALLVFGWQRIGHVALVLAPNPGGPTVPLYLVLLTRVWLAASGVAMAGFLLLALDALLERRTRTPTGAVPFPQATRLVNSRTLLAAHIVWAFQTAVAAATLWRDSTQIFFFAPQLAIWYGAPAWLGLLLVTAGVCLGCYRRVGAYPAPKPPPVLQPKPPAAPPSIVEKLLRWARNLSRPPEHRYNGSSVRITVMDLLASRWDELAADLCLQQTLAAADGACPEWTGWLVRSLQHTDLQQAVAEDVIVDGLVDRWLTDRGWAGLVDELLQHGRPLRQLLEMAVPTQWPPGFQRPVRDIVLLNVGDRFEIIDLTSWSREAERTFRRLVAQLAGQEAELELIRFAQGMTLPNKVWLGRKPPPAGHA